MKKYNETIKTKLNSFIKKNLKQKINFLLSIVGIKQIIYKSIYIFLSLFLKNNLVFLRGIIFEINKKKSKYIFLDTMKKEKFLMFSNDEVVSKELFMRGDFDLGKFYKVLNILKTKYSINNIYDIGANIGTVCIPAVKRGLITKAIAIEPEKENYKLLKLNISLNNLDSKIETYNYALSFEDDKILDLEISNKNSGDHRIRLSNTKPGIHGEEYRKTTKVKSKTFDNMFSNVNPKNDLIWIDTQGFESNILMGAKKLILSGAPIVIEFWPYGLKLNNSLEKLKDLLKNFKYYYDLSDNLDHKKEINFENVESLFSGWDEEKSNKHNLFTDVLLLSE